MPSVEGSGTAEALGTNSSPWRPLPAMISVTARVEGSTLPNSLPTLTNKEELGIKPVAKI